MSCQEKQEIYLFHEEIACAERCLAFLQKGCMVTQYLFQSIRAYNTESNEIYQAVEASIRKNCLRKYQINGYIVLRIKQI